MKVAVGELPQVVLEYFEAVILPAASRAGGVAPFIAGLAGGLVSRQVPDIVERYLPVAIAFGLVDAENKLDIDLLYDEATKSLEKNSLAVAGYHVDKNDLDKLKSIMEKHGG